MKNHTNRKVHKGDIVFGIMFLLLGVMICVLTLRDYELMSEYSLGPGFFPLIIGIALIILSLIILIMTFWGVFSNDEISFPGKDGRNSIIRFSLLILAMAALFNILGLILSFVLFIFAEMVFVEHRTIKSALLTSVITTAAIYIFFVILFKVNVPVGFLGF